MRIGSKMYVSGTTATDDNSQIIGINYFYAQTVQIIKNIETTLTKLGAILEDLLQTRIYVTNIDNWKKVCQAHGMFVVKFVLQLQ